MKTKLIWIIGVLLALIGAGCRFVESTAEQQALGDQASPAGAEEAGASLPRPSPPAASQEEASSAGAPEAAEAPKAPSPGSGTPEAGTTAPPAPGTPPQKAADTPETSPSAPSPTEPAEKGQGPTPSTPPPPTEAESPQPSAARPGSAETSEAETPQPPLKAEAEPATKPAPPLSAQQMKELAQQIAKAQAMAKALSEKEPTREPEEVPGGGAKPKSEPPTTRKPEPPKPAPAAAAGPRSVETPVREAKPAEQGQEGSERKLASAPRPTAPERETRPAPEARSERLTEAEEALQAEQQAWEEAERARQAQRQAAFASIKRHLARAEDALDGQKNGLPEALSALQRMRRSLGFLRSALTPVATWYHLDCALALLQENQIDAAREQLDAALALIPVTLPAEGEEATPAPQGTTEADPEEPAAGQTARPPEESASEGGTTDRTEGTEGESAEPTLDLRARLIEWRDALQGDAPEEAQRALEQLLSEAPASAEEELLDNLEAEIDYACEALGRGSRKAAEMELGSIRENVDELARLVLGEAPSGESQAETQESAAAGEEATEGPQEPSGDTGLTPPSSATEASPMAGPGTKRTSRLPTAALLGGLAIGLLVWGRTRRPRP